jgi:hypothetical protein
LNRRRVLKGIKPNAKTLAAYMWGEREVNRIRALDDTYRTVLKYAHDVDWKALYAGKTAMPPINLPRVQVAAAPTPPPRPHYPQDLQDTPKKGTGTPIYWANIDTFWSADLQKHNIGNNFARKVMRDGRLVADVYWGCAPRRA